MLYIYSIDYYSVFFLKKGNSAICDKVAGPFTNCNRLVLEEEMLNDPIHMRYLK